MPMVDSSTQVSPSLPPPPPLGTSGTPWPAAPQPQAGPSKTAARPPQSPPVPIDEKAAPEGPRAAAAAPAPGPQPPRPRIQIIQAPRTPCVAQPIAILGYLAGVGLGIVIGLSYAGILAPATGVGAAVLALMLLLFLAGAPPFHATYPQPGPRPT